MSSKDVAFGVELNGRFQDLTAQDPEFLRTWPQWSMDQRVWTGAFAHGFWVESVAGTVRTPTGLRSAVRPVMGEVGRNVQEPKDSQDESVVWRRRSCAVQGATFSEQTSRRGSPRRRWGGEAETMISSVWSPSRLSEKSVSWSEEGESPEEE